MKTRKTGKAVTVILTIIVCAFALFPFIWMLSTSFKTNSEIYTAAPAFVPKEPTAAGYVNMFTTETSTFNFKQWAANSVFVAFLVLCCADDPSASGFPAYDSAVHYYGKL